MKPERVYVLHIAFAVNNLNLVLSEKFTATGAVPYLMALTYIMKYNPDQSYE